MNELRIEDDNEQYVLVKFCHLNFFVVMRSEVMVSRKRSSKPARTHGIDVGAIRADMQDEIRTSNSAPAMPTCLAKLISQEPAEREEGCQDVMHFALSPVHIVALKYHNAHRKVARLIIDSNVHVRAAAAAALRNLLVASDDSMLDDTVKEENVAVLVARSIQELLTQHPSLLQSFLAHPEIQLGAEVDESNEQVQKQDMLATLLGGVESALDESFQLAAVIAEGSETSTETLFSSTEFLQLTIAAICSMSRSPRESCAAIAVSAAETLHLISSENDAVAAFLGSGLSPEQQQEMDVWIQGGPQQPGSPLVISPRLLRLCLGLGGTLVNVAPK
jgi:hypothetical protein